MAKTEKEQPEVDVDEHGLKIQKHRSMVLVIVPSSGYDETVLRYARSSLHNVHVGTRTVSTEDVQTISGLLQDTFQVDGPLAGETMAPYSGIILCSGDGAGALASDPDALRLLAEADAAGKMIASWGIGVSVLASARVLKGKRVTGARSVREAVNKAGGRYTGTQIECCGMVVTALDDAAGFRFGKALVQVVAI